MKELLDFFAHRRSVRKYSGAPVTQEQLEAIVRAGLTAGSGHAWYPCDVILVRDRAMLEKLSECRVGAAKMLAEADCAVAVIGDADKSDTWVEDASIIMTNMQLMASGLGLGSCWIQGRTRTSPDGRETDAVVRELLQYPEPYRLEAILSLGVPAQHPGDRMPDMDDKRIHLERF